MEPATTSPTVRGQPRTQQHRRPLPDELVGANEPDAQRIRQLDLVRQMGHERPIQRNGRAHPADGAPAAPDLPGAGRRAGNERRARGHAQHDVTTRPLDLSQLGAVVTEERPLHASATSKDPSAYLRVREPGLVRHGCRVETGHQSLVRAFPVALGRIAAGHPDSDRQGQRQQEQGSGKPNLATERDAHLFPRFPFPPPWSPCPPPWPRFCPGVAGGPGCLWLCLTSAERRPLDRAADFPRCLPGFASAGLAGAGGFDTGFAGAAGATGTGATGRCTTIRRGIRRNLRRATGRACGTVRTTTAADD